MRDGGGTSSWRRANRGRDICYRGLCSIAGGQPNADRDATTSTTNRVRSGHTFADGCRRPNHARSGSANTHRDIADAGPGRHFAARAGDSRADDASPHQSGIETGGNHSPRSKCRG
jgi:hypothetical protein